MSGKHYPKIFPILIVALSVTALARPGAPGASAVEHHAAAVGITPETATSTLPLRWRIPYAQHRHFSTEGAMVCATVVSVLNSSPSVVEIDVEFFNQSGTSQGGAFATPVAGRSTQFATFPDAPLTPFLPESLVNTGNFDGFALVFASDPRIGVGAYLVCHEEGAGGQLPATVTNLSAHPVGQSAAFFQAATPGTPAAPATER